jgi:hypothetical protein
LSSLRLSPSRPAAQPARFGSHRDVLTIAAAILLGVLTFAFRLLLSPDLSNDHYMHMAWAQQVLLGGLPGRDFVDPGMPGMILLSAAAQYLRPGPYSETLLAVGMLALATAAITVATSWISGSRLAGIGVAVLAIAIQPRLYSYPKILVPPIALLLLYLYSRRRGPRLLVLLGVWTVIAALLRHDLGLYAAAGSFAGLVAMALPDLRRAAVAVGWYVAGAVASGLPYLLYVQWSEGVGEHLRRGVEFSHGESREGLLVPPDFPFLHGTWALSTWTSTDSAALLFYAANLLLVAALGLLIAGRRRFTREQRGVAVSGIVMLASYLLIILRHPIEARLPDMAGIGAVMAGWSLAGIGHVVAANVKRRPVPSVLAAVTAVGACAAISIAVWILGNLPEKIRKTNLMEGSRAIGERLEQIRTTGTEWPWDRYWPTGTPPLAVRYIEACTSPSDRVMLTWPAPQYYFFTRRAFAAGHGLFLPPRAFTTEKDQQQALSWLGQHPPVVVLINDSLREEFARAYPLIDAYLSRDYTAYGHFTIYDGSDITLASRNGLRPAREYGPEHWPCAFESPAQTDEGADR